MLTFLQYLSVISAFFLPWTLCGIIKYAKSGERKKVVILVSILVACAAVISLTVWLAFSLG